MCLFPPSENLSLFFFLSPRPDWGPFFSKHAGSRDICPRIMRIFVHCGRGDIFVGTNSIEPNEHNEPDPLDGGK